MATIAIISAGTAAYSSREQAKNQNEFAETNAAHANEAAALGYEAQGTRLQQDREAAGQRRTNSVVAAEQARASARTVAGESGVAGMSIDSLINDITRQEAQNTLTIDTNSDMAYAQSRLEGRGVSAQARDRINSAPKGYFNPLLETLKIAAAGAGGYYGQATPGAGASGIPRGVDAAAHYRLQNRLQTVNPLALD